MLAAWLFWLAAAAAPGVTPYALECEARVNPIGVDATAPRLSWKLRSDQQGQRQTAYEILAASSPDRLARNEGDLWASGRVNSDETTWIPYAGAALHPFQRVWWKVRAWDAAGVASSWSGPADWTVGMLDSIGWRGAWIASPDHALRSGPLPIFRKEVTVEKPLRRALALVSGLGFHELHINGAKVGDHVLAPAWTNFRAGVNYEAFDVTPLLANGANAIGVMLGNGFYNVAGGRYVKYTGSFGQPRLWLQLHLESEDGASRDVTTDGSWRVHDSPVTFSCIYGGEDYDARLEMPGWDRAGYDDSAWPRASTVEPPSPVLRAQASPPIRVQETLKMVRVTEPKPGVFVYDLGRNFAGWPRVTASGPAGAQVRMTTGELLDGAGLVTQRSSGGPTYFTFTLKGAGRETWSPRFAYTGFRYVQVEGTAKIESLEGQFIHLDAANIGHFSCSNELFNRIHALIEQAVRSNLQHVLTDCPHREKLGWLEQSHLMGPSLLYNWDLRAFLEKIARDMREAQTIDGLVPDIAPEYVVFRGGFRDSPEWGSAGVLVPWLGWTWYGDRALLADSYHMMRAYTDYLGTQAKDDLLSYGLGDWYDIGPGSPGRSQLTPLGVTATAFYWDDLRVVEQAARLLGFNQDAGQCTARASSVREAFQKAFYKAAETTYATGSQTSLAMPLALGLAPEAARAALVEKLVADVRAHGNHTTAGDIGYRYVLAALREAGRSDVIFDLANQTTAPSYAAQLAADATSLTEAWNADPRSSQNHLMLGHVEEWFYAGLAGIRPDPSSPGLRHILIAPEPVGDVHWVEARWDTFRGPVAVRWRKESGTFSLHVELPPGMTAEVRLPGGARRFIVSGASDFQVPVQ
jgi:alpha-L-rhamnosidase